MLLLTEESLHRVPCVKMTVASVVKMATAITVAVAINACCFMTVIKLGC